MSAEYNALLFYNTWTLVPPNPHYNLIGKNGSFAFNNTLTVPSSAIRLVWSLKVTVNSPELTTTKPLLLLSSTALFVLFWPLLSLEAGRCVNLTCIMLFCMAIYQKRCTWSNLRVSFIRTSLPTFVVSTVHFMVLTNLQEPGWLLFYRGFRQTKYLWFEHVHLHAMHGSHTLILLLYVDDIAIFGSSNELIQSLIASMQTSFSMKSFFSLLIGVEIIPTCLMLSKKKYILEFIERHHMSEAKPVVTPLHSKQDWSSQESELLSDPSEYGRIVGSLQSLSFKRKTLLHFAVNLSSPPSAP